MVSEFQKRVLEKEIEEIKDKLSGDFMSDLELRDEIHKREMILSGTEPGGEYSTCEFCSG